MTRAPALGQKDRSRGEGRGGVKKRSVECGGDRRELGGGSACTGNVAACQHDFDVGRQDPGPGHPISGRVDHPPDGRQCGIELTLSESQHRQPRLRVMAPLGREAVRLLGGIELAAQPVKVAEQEIGCADRRLA